MRTPDFRLTIRQTMWLVFVAAVGCVAWVYLRRWEARRTIMYQQRDVTRSIMLQAKQDIGAAGHSASEIHIERPRGTYTAEWTEWIEAWENRGGDELSL